MELTQKKTKRDGNAAAVWLGEEFEKLARELGAEKSDCATLNRVVGKLAEASGENGETHWRVPAGTEREFLEKAVAETPLNALAGTPATFSAGKKTPLIFDAKNAALYFFRRYKQEISIAEKIVGRGKISENSLDEKTEKLIESALPFPLNTRQKLAVRAIVSGAFTIISGGPGTGKTTLLLRALLCIFSRNPDAKISLAAPTGKAAGRMKESVLAQLNAIPDSAKSAAGIPAEIVESAKKLEPTTLHRLLRTGTSPLKNSPVPAISADCVVVDEASMIDQDLMFRLICAISPRTHLVLLGDKNQLDSVGAGHVFGALCETEILRENRIELTESRRFSESGILGKFANAVVSGDVPAAEISVSPATKNVPANFHFSEKEITPHVLENALRELFPAELQRVSETANPEKILRAFESVRVLAPTRVGDCGTEFINALARKIFAPTGTQAHLHFHGQPIIVTRNAPQNRLFNGDVGVVLKDAASGSFSAFFRDDCGLKRVPAALLPEHETAYAMSIHKSQGSEFSRLLIVFPKQFGNAELFSRQLLYTAITRFREHENASYFRLLFDKESLLAAVARERPNISLLPQRFSATRASDNVL